MHAGTFSIISQSMTLNCFPRVRIVHTSAKVKGQIYIPEINWVLLIIGIALILGFTLTQPASSPVNTAQLGNAFGARTLSHEGLGVFNQYNLVLLYYYTSNDSGLFPWQVRAVHMEFAS
jgi:hypothetical protein